MTDFSSPLQVLLVEDNHEDMAQFLEYFPLLFSDRGLEIEIDNCESFEEAELRTQSRRYRYDLVISDTYRGNIENHEVGVLGLIESYKRSRFCPLIICSSGRKPPEVKEGPFLRWADKADNKEIQAAIEFVLSTGIPQLARRINDELNGYSGAFLWDFLESQWQALNDPEKLDQSVLERMIRRRAALQIGDMDPTSDQASILQRAGAEYYIYPPWNQIHFNLGDLVRRASEPDDLRVILTPHCHLITQSGQSKPKADFVLTVKTVKAANVIGKEKLRNAKAKEPSAQERTCSVWFRSPAQTGRSPDGRHWYLPRFLDIPHSYCDFLQVESIEYTQLKEDFKRVATLAPPYAEALQSCFAGFYSSVGIPVISHQSVTSLLDE